MFFDSACPSNWMRDTRLKGFSSMHRSLLCPRLASGLQQLLSGTLERVSDERGGEVDAVQASQIHLPAELSLE